MKKIVAAASIAAIATTAAFADAKITLNNRTKLDAFASVKTTDDNGTKETVTKKIEWMDWAGYDGAGAQAQANASDSLKFVLDGERAGVTLNINVAESEKETAKFMVLNQYSAWAKWDLGPGSLKLEAGNWKDGYADGSYRVKKDVDAQNAEGMDFERFKLGSILKGNKGAFVDELGASNSAVSGYATYSVNATDDIKINATIGGNYSKFDDRKSTEDDTTTTKYFDSTFVGRLQFNVADILNSEIIYKQQGPHNGSFGIFVKPTMLGALDATVGFSMNKQNEGTYGTGKEYLEKDTYTDWALDLRARYAFSPAFSLTFFTNVSGTNLEGADGDKKNGNSVGRALSAGLVGHKGAEGWATKTAVKTAMWNNLSCRYKINDTLTATLNIGLLSMLGKTKAVEDLEISYKPEWRITPAVQVYAGGNASVWAGVALSGTGTSFDKDGVESKNSVFAVQVPVIFRVKM